MLKKRLTSILFFFTALSLSAQTAARIEELLQTEAVNYRQAAQFVLEAADVLGVNMSPDAGFRNAAGRQWLPKKVASNDTANVQGVCLLIMRSFDIKGGFLYSLFKNPHFAYREMIYQNILQDRIDPDKAVSGELLLFLVNRVLSRYDEIQRNDE